MSVPAHRRLNRLAHLCGHRLVPLIDICCTGCEDQQLLPVCTVAAGKQPARSAMIIAELNTERLGAAFDTASPLTVGIEEELMLLDTETGDLTPKAAEIVEGLDGDPRFKLELPAAQLEIVTTPHDRVGDAIAELRAGREDLAAATAGRVRLAAAGTHPVSPCFAPLNAGQRYERTRQEYGAIANRQVVFALQVHVAPGSADRALGVYNALRSYLPAVAALAANAPFLEGDDTGLASVRPKLCELLPRQGVPPPIESWGAFTDMLRWGRAARAVPEPGWWWWELRPHVRFGTLELRVPDSQTTLHEASGIAALAQCLVAWLTARFDAGEMLPVAPTWRIAENRWRAARDGVDAEFADLETGERTPARRYLCELIDRLVPVAQRLGCAEELAAARGMAFENGAMRQRLVAAEVGIVHLPEWLAERWLDV